ncbi:hypothetical protein MMC16_002485 [Acarospora aff. strigata]|nr:hypothetical protein [Acarospora aff. strigata]
MLSISALLISWLITISPLVAMPTTTTSLQRREITCTVEAYGVLKTLDCINAILNMQYNDRPNGRDDGMGQFSLHAPAGSAWKLPRYFGSGTCMVGVSLIGVTTADDEETSSWTDIAHKAYDIVHTCVRQSARKEDQRGGTDFAGPRGKIRIDVFAAQRHLAFLVDHNDPRVPRPRIPNLNSEKTVARST